MISIIHKRSTGFIMKIVSALRFALSLLIVTVLLSAAALAGSPSEPVKVAIYNHSGDAAKAPKTLMKFLVPESGFQCTVVTPAEIREGILADFDVLIMPGGSGSAQSKNLEEKGRDVIREFVKEGGGYVGICAGSYLASSHYEWSLGIINAKVWNRSHWARGTGQVSMCLSPAGCKLLENEGESLEVYYGQGPLLVPDNKPDLPGYEVLATYTTEIAKKGAPEGAMIDTHAIIRTMYGNGRVICFSPHPETASGPNHIMAEGIRWAGLGK